MKPTPDWLKLLTKNMAVHFVKLHFTHVLSDWLFSFPFASSFSMSHHVSHLLLQVGLRASILLIFFINSIFY